MAHSKDKHEPKIEDVFIGSIHQGTTSTRFIIYYQKARQIGSHQIKFTQFYPEAGWVEYDPMEILESLMKENVDADGLRWCLRGAFGWKFLMLWRVDCRSERFPFSCSITIFLSNKSKNTCMFVSVLSCNEMKVLSPNKTT